MYILNNSDNFFFHRKKPAPGPPQGWIKKMKSVKKLLGQRKTGSKVVKPYQTILENKMTDN